MDARAGSLKASAGERIRRFRTERGLTQAAVACQVGITQATLSNYELGKRPMLFSTAIALADCFGVPLRALIEGSGFDRGGASPVRPFSSPRHSRLLLSQSRDQQGGVH